MTEEEKLIESIKKQVGEQLQTRASAKDVEAIVSQLSFLKKNDDGTGGFPIEALREMADPTKGVMSILLKQGEEIQKLAKQNSERPQDMSVRGQIKSWLAKSNDYNEATGEDVQGGITVLEAVRQMKSGKKVDLRPLEIRAANSPMLPSNTYGNSAYLPKPEIQAGLVDVLRVQPTFWDFLKKGATGSAAYVWVNKKVPAGSGAAAWLAPGQYKPPVSFSLNTEISNAKKIAVNEKVAIELLDDIDGLSSWVEEELMYQLKIKLNSTLLTGTGDSVTPKSITELAVPFAGANLGVTTTNANNWDAIRACVAQLKTTYFGAYPVTTFMNPVDYANMVMTKAQNQGQLFIPPVTGSTIVEELSIPVGHVLVACLDLYKILIYKGFTMTYGLENDDFTKNLRTVIGEMRLHQIFSENHQGAFIYDTFENIITGITATA
jgi:HK97 family phage major capsid protein